LFVSDLDILAIIFCSELSVNDTKNYTMTSKKDFSRLCPVTLQAVDWLLKFFYWGEGCCSKVIIDSIDVLLHYLV